MTAEARGYLIKAVREARWSIRDLRKGDTFAALNRLCYAWRYLGLSERGMVPSAETAGALCSYERAERAVNAAQRAFAEAWPARYGLVKRVLYAAV